MGEGRRILSANMAEHRGLAKIIGKAPSRRGPGSRAARLRRVLREGAWRDDRRKDATTSASRRTGGGAEKTCG
eukprot:2367550-Pyramimonas_sp.AAC.1